MFCTRCGTQNDDAARFCRNCSQPLTRTGAAQSPPSQRPPSSDAPYPGYQGGQNPGFQSQQPSHPNAPPSFPQSYASSQPGTSQSQGASGRAVSALILGILSIMANLACCCYPFSFVSLPLGIASLVLGKQEMDAIRAGLAQRAGETFAKVGFYLGIAGTVLSALIGVLYFLGLLAKVFELYQVGGGRF